MLSLSNTKFSPLIYKEMCCSWREELHVTIRSCKLKASCRCHLGTINNRKFFVAKKTHCRRGSFIMMPSKYVHIFATNHTSCWSWHGWRYVSTCFNMFPKNTIIQWQVTCSESVNGFHFYLVSAVPLHVARYSTSVQVSQTRTC